MPDSDLGRTIAKNLKRLLYERNISPTDISRALGIKPSTISGWLNEFKVPRGNTIDALCDYLHCSRLDLIGESAEEKPYYLNEETERIAQEVFDDPDLRLLLDSSRGVSPENIRLAAEMLKRFKETNNG